MSVLEMESNLTGTRFSTRFIDYIVDVIKAFTPEIPVPHRPGNYHEYLFGKNSAWKAFGHFILSAFNAKINVSPSVTKRNRQIEFSLSRTKSNCKYAIISLNYDLVIENIITYINMHYPATNPEDEIKLTRSLDEFDQNWDSLNLVKLHGSVDSGTIVPPTWSKSMHKDIRAEWRRAYQLLVSANHVRFIGYSMPQSDSYVNYLLKSAVLKTPHLKGIDAICLDNDGDVKLRFDDLVEFRYKRFSSSRTETYLDRIKVHEMPRDGHGLTGARFDNLETVHNDSFQSDR